MLRLELKIAWAYRPKRHCCPRRNSPTRSMWNDVWNDVKTTSSCEEQPVFGDSTTRPDGTCGSATTGTIYCTFKTASKHAQHSAICWAARWNARATNRSLFPLLPDLLGSKLERPGSPTCEEAPKLCLVLRTG